MDAKNIEKLVQKAKDDILKEVNKNQRDWYLIPHHNKRRKITFPIQIKSRNQKPFSMIHKMISNAVLL